MTTCDAFLAAAEVAAAQIRDPAVVARWAERSALPGLSVGGLARHLANQITRTVPALAVTGTGPGGSAVPVVPLVEHFRRSAWFTEDIDGADNVRIRTQGDAGAGVPGTLAAEVDAALAELRRVLPGQPGDRAIEVDEWALTLDDFLVTRLLELVVHGDDLAVSTGTPTPDLPPAAVSATVRLLADLAAWRHGGLAVVRALARRERAPDNVAAL